jgi:hypothetical protein
VVVNLIASTRTEKGLTIEAEIDDTFHTTGFKTPDEEITNLATLRDEFHGEGTCKIYPEKQTMSTHPPKLRCSSYVHVIPAKAGIRKCSRKP